MSDPKYLLKEFTSANEPKVHPLVRKSFVFVPSAGARYAPEILVLELMREIFYPKHFGDYTGTRELNADEVDDKDGKRYIHSDRDRSVLYALRGRRKETGHSKAWEYFAPAYPCLAKYGWLRKSADRVINNFLFAGPIAQYLWHRGPDTEDGKRKQQELVDKVWCALLGSSSYLGQSLDGKDILAVVLGATSFDTDGTLPKHNLEEKTNPNDYVIRMDNDELSNRITLDFIAICNLEPSLPRMQWIQLLMTFLRFALPMWLLAQVQITMLLHSWLVEASDNGKIASIEAVEWGLSGRNRGLLHPTMTPMRELFEHVERYMKCRVELDILLYCLEMVRQDCLSKKTLNLRGGGRDVLGIAELLTLARDASGSIRNTERFKAIANGTDIKTFLTREGEQFAAWRNPLMRGQGKNIDEFFRVLYRAELGDEAGGYMLVPEGRNRGFRVFPGQLLLKTVTYLAAQGKLSCRQQGGAGKLVLQDIEEHFGQYGIDFSSAVDARPLLMKELQAMGLLTGSPDAGSSVAVACPY